MSDRLLALALCWRLERRDGVTLALTAHDRDLVIEGLVYRAAPGMTPSAVALGSGLDADTMAAEGAFTVAAITARDLADGRWDGARVVCLAVDWSDANAAPLPLGEGRIGAVTARDRDFTAELSGAQARLDRPAVELTAPTCRAELGDRRCRVMMAARRRFARVVAVGESAALTLDAEEPVAGAYAGGVLRWFGGGNAGLVSAVAASAGARVTLEEAPPHAVTAGTLVELVEGCDKRLATCAARFGNAVNFRGEPYVPGNDLLTRYPAG